MSAAMMNKVLLTIASLSLIAAVASPSMAQERYRIRPYHHHYVAVRDAAPPLTIHGRSYLDAGVVAPVGSESAYVADSTTFNEPVRSLFYGRFDSQLPRPLDVPGRQQSIIDFETPRID